MNQKLNRERKNEDCHTTTIYENIFMLAQDYGMFSVVAVAVGIIIIIAFLANQTIKQEKKWFMQYQNSLDNVTILIHMGNKILAAQIYLCTHIIFRSEVDLLQ